MINRHRYDHLSPNVRSRIARGEVPPPRSGSDPVDPVRDLRLEIATAEDEGDWEAVKRLNAQWLTEVRKGHDVDSWQPEPPAPPAPQVLTPASRSDYLKAAQQAEREGDANLANAYKLKAARASDPDSDLTRRARQAEKAQDWEEVGRINVEMIYAAAGEDVPAPPPAPEPLPQTTEELAEAANQAEAAGDSHRASRCRTAMLALQRAKTETTVSY